MKRILLLTCLLLAVFCTCAAAEDEPLFIAREGWKQGFINREGEWVIPPEYVRVWPFTDAGYAAVEPNETYESQEVSFYNPFILIDKTGKIVTELPEWRLGTDPDPNILEATQNAVGGVYVLSSMESEDRKSALYVVETGELTELNQDFLGYVLSPEAEEDAEWIVQHYYDIKHPSSFILAGWNDRIVLVFDYTDFVKSSIDGRKYDKQYCFGFVILDRQGRKLHEGCFDGYPEGLMNPEPECGYTIQGSCLLTSSRTYNEQTPVCLIDRDGNIILSDLPEGSYWDEELQAVCLGKTGEAVLLNGKRISADEYRERRAALNPSGTMADQSGYYDGQDTMTEWPEQEAFSDGWKCVYDEENHSYSYINPAGEKMYDTFRFEYAEPFRNGAAHVKVMDKSYAFLDAYLGTDGRVIWAEEGKKKEVQRCLDEGIMYKAEDMSLEEARQNLIGEWDGGGGEYLHFQSFFYENGTSSGAIDEENWTLLENTRGEDAFYGAPFVLVFGDRDISGKPEQEWGLWFINRDCFCVCSDEGTIYVSRVSPGYWERCRQTFELWRETKYMKAV